MSLIGCHFVLYFMLLLFICFSGFITVLINQPATCCHLY